MGRGLVFISTTNYNILDNHFISLYPKVDHLVFFARNTYLDIS